MPDLRVKAFDRAILRWRVALLAGSIVHTLLVGGLVWLAPSVASAATAAPAGKDTVNFQRDIRPILSDRCFKCHGPDEGKREAGLRLDTLAGALRDRDGFRPVVPGKPGESELIARVTSKDAEERMPPVDDHAEPLLPAQIDLLRRWIAQGAKWDEHWSFKPPVKLAPPVVTKSSAPLRNPIDHFVAAKLLASGLNFSKETDKATLIRRVSFDLTGLPPTPAEVDAFLADSSPDAYERVVTRLLASPRYGERMAVDWLDGARYADSNGMFRDDARQAWPWRDWVIAAFNRNQPYDQFTLEQLAGDLLPNPTPEQRIATGFNRNNMVSGESGIIDEEYRVEYVANRLDTTSTVWLGLTLACARCHDHKYDPLSQKDYYSFFSFFNNTPETGLVKEDDPPPVMDVASAAQRGELDRLTAVRRAADAQYEKLTAPLRATMGDWEKAVARELAPALQPVVAHVDFEPANDSGGSASSDVLEKGSVYYEPGLLGQAAVFDSMQHLELPATLSVSAAEPWTFGIWAKPSASLSCLFSKIEPAGQRRGVEVLWQKGRVVVNIVNEWGVKAIEVTTRDPVPGPDWRHIVVSYDGTRKAAGVRIYGNGAAVPLTILRDTLTGDINNAEPLRLGRRDSGLGYYGRLDEFQLLARAVELDDAREWFWADRLRGALAVPLAKRDAQQKKALLDYYVQRRAEPAVREANEVAGKAREAERIFRAQLPKTLVMQELPEPRQAHVLMRGQYDQPGEAVPTNVPASLPPLPADAPRNRLGLAKWLTAPDHPLTARVRVNRLWQQAFGEGLVRTINDFGAQGESPTHPELLDWLAVEFVESGWDTKHLLKLIVTSTTYRQSSVAAPDVLERDPENRLLARGPRFRLSAEMIRDQALFASGLLVERIGGPPTKPYQPAGLWEAVSYNGELTYQTDQGDGLWRRSVYTFWKRQAPPPAILTFDSPTRETCAVSRPRTNTPMQALVLLNDESYVEAARALAALTLANGGATTAELLSFAFRRVTSRPAQTAELSILRKLHEQQRARYTADPAAARQLVGIGVSRMGGECDPVELAAWTAVAQTLVNLDETITRR